MKGLQGKRVVVTGGTSGIGEATSRRFLDAGATAFREALAAIGVTDLFYELFDATHSGIEYRYPLALRYLAERLQ